ncbi:MAG: hypothetical protein MI810_01815 [Flavobacteriales bacterium]|nr:hypothetical protein [Flavobacteriales bacterium]
MRLALIILISIHGIIHLFGFFKAFEIAEFNTINQPISRALGLIWLLTFVLFAMAIASMLVHFKYWWIIGLAAVLTSQWLIFNFWFDAKFGTIANVIILGATIIAYSTFQFNHKVSQERKRLLENSKNLTQQIVTESAISNLPVIVQKWLKHSGIVGKESISNVRLVQDLQLKMKEDQKAWNTAKADQYFSIQPPAFNWKLNMQMGPGIEVVGRDKFENGDGEMVIKMLSLIPIANGKNSTKIDEASLQRYLAEIVWFPSAALSPYISWESVDEQSAKATMSYKETKGSGIFHFGQDGEFVSFTAMRFKDIKDDEPKLWTVNALKTEERNGIRIPVECEAQWKLADQDWTWLKLKIIDIEYDVKTVYDE